MVHLGVGYDRPIGTRGFISGSMVVIGTILLLAFLLSMSSGDSDASPNPPPFGDWTVGTGETVSHSGATLDLRGDLHIRGSLELDNSTLWIWLDASSSNVLTVHPGAELTLTNSILSAQGIGRGYVVRAEVGSTLDLDGASFLRAGYTLTDDGREAGLYVATPTTMRGVQFVDCLVGLWTADTQVRVLDSNFVGCRYGAVVSDGGTLNVSGGSFVDCERGALTNASRLIVTDAVVDACDEGLLAYGGNLNIMSTEIFRSKILGVGSYSADLHVRDVTIRDADSDGIVVHKSQGRVVDCLFVNLTTDIKAIHSEVWITGTVHRDTYDEALWMYHATFHIERVNTVDSYWGLRAYKSTGECRRLVTMNATFGVQLERCIDVTLQYLEIVGGYSTLRPNPRGLVVTGGPFKLLDSNISNVRTGIDLLSAEGTVERVNITDCAHQGVIVSLSWAFTFRDVNVTDAVDGFLMTLYSGGRLERCTARQCRAAGFNFTARSTTYLFSCNGSSNPLGVNCLYASPTIRDFDLYQTTADGRPTNRTLGMDILESQPDIRGGTIKWGYGGIRLNGTQAIIKDVTFESCERWGILVLESHTDIIEGCRFLDFPNATGVFVFRSFPVITGNEFFRVNYAITGTYGSHLVIEDNTIINVTWDGIWLHGNTSAEMRGNLIMDVGWYGVHVMLFSHLVSREDVLRDTGRVGILVWMASTLDMQGSSIINSSIGINAKDVTWIRVAFSEFRDLNRGILLTRNMGRNALVGQSEGYVEGCYFTNNSAYAIGAYDSNMTVIDSNFLDNIAAIQVSNCTLRLVDGTMVGSWLFGIKAEGFSTVEWRVEDRCRIVSSDLYGPLKFIMRGGSLHIEDSIVDIEYGGSFSARDGDITMRGVQWLAGGTTFRAMRCDVELVNSTFLAVGPSVGGAHGEVGVSLTDSVATISGCSFRRTRIGVSMVRTNGTIMDSRFFECAEDGIYGEDSNITLVNTRINNTLVGNAIHLESSSLLAFSSGITHAVRGIFMVGSEASLYNCSVGGATMASFQVESSLLELYNTTHQTDRVQVHTGGVVNTWWYLSARVLWPDRTELTSARVSVWDIYEVPVANGTPNGAGMVWDMIILASINEEGSITLMGPHTAFADLRGYTVDVVVNLTSSQTVVLDLKDDEPPVFQMGAPLETEIWTRTNAVWVFGVAFDAGAGTETVRVKIDSALRSWKVEGDTFSFNITLPEGRHLVDLVATDLAGNEAVHTIILHVETTPIAMSPPEPADGTMTRESSVLLHGRLSRNEDVTVRINRVLADIDENSYWSLQVDLQEGENGFSILVEDIYGHQTWANITIWADWTPPDLRLTSYLDVNTTEEWVEVTGYVDEDARVYIQGSLVLLRDGTFSIKYPVYVGESEIVVRAVDDIGNEREIQVLVYRVDESVVPEGPNPWEVYIFLVIIPILLVLVYLVMRRLELGGEKE